MRLAVAAPAAATADNVCYGRVADGRFEGGAKLPLDGENLESYRALPSTAGRLSYYTVARSRRDYRP